MTKTSATETRALIECLRADGFTEARIREVLENEPGYAVRLLRKYGIAS